MRNPRTILTLPETDPRCPCSRQGWELTCFFMFFHVPKQFRGSFGCKPTPDCGSFEGSPSPAAEGLTSDGRPELGEFAHSIRACGVLA